ncbi:MAG: hypothetical protein ACI90V_002891, partial [Bacillariaceae sp.]
EQFDTGYSIIQSNTEVVNSLDYSSYSLDSMHHHRFLFIHIPSFL